MYKQRILVALVAIYFLGAAKNQNCYAQISVTGTTNPAYDGSDPWLPADFLNIGFPGVETQFTIAGGSEVRNVGISIRGFDGLGTTCTVTGTGSKLVSNVPGNSGDLNLESTGPSILNIENGGEAVCDDCIIGDSSFDTGEINVVGPGSKLMIEQAMFVAESGTGNVFIESGGSIETDRTNIGLNFQSVGLVSIDGAGSSWVNSSSTVDFSVGRAGAGTLNVSGGALVEVGRDADIGEFNSGEGTVNVSGVGSQWLIAQDIFLGLDGTGILSISDGAMVCNRFSWLGRDAGGLGTASVSGTGSLWDNSLTLRIGSFGMGSLDVNSGGGVSCGGLDIGIQSDSIGMAFVDGVGSEIVSSGSIAIGVNGTGSLEISNGGTVSCVSGTIGQNNLSDGQITVTGASSQLNVTNNLSLGTFGNTMSGAKLEIRDGAEVVVGGTLGLLNFDPPCVRLDGGALRVGTLEQQFGIGLEMVDGFFSCTAVNGFLEQDGAVFQPDNSNGTTQIDFNYIMNAGSVEFEIGGTMAGIEHDQLSAGSVDINGGFLDIQFINGFQPTIGQQFLIVENRSGSQPTNGSFNGLPEGARITCIGGVDLFISYIGGDGNDVVLTAMATPTLVLGDVNQDGVANLLDIEPFIAVINSGGYQCEADANQDGVVNLLDVEDFIAILNGG